MQAVIGYGVAQNLNLQVGDTFQSSHGLKEDNDLIHEDHRPIQIVGILKPSGTVMDQLLLTDFRTVWEVHDHQHSQEPSEEESSLATLATFNDQSITTLLIQLKSRNFQALNFQRNINENTNLQAATPAIEINRLYANIGMGISLLRALAIAIVFVSGISIFVSLYNSLKDRKYEMALMRVMGGSRFNLFKLVLLEGLILAVFGWLSGVILGHFGLEMIAHSLKSTYKYSLSGITFISAEWLVMWASILIGLLASLFPALEAARTNIHKTLSEGK
jgi:putative ABC transport system permease protein